jgi:hypothetical protein
MGDSVANTLKSACPAYGAYQAVKQMYQLATGKITIQELKQRPSVWGTIKSYYNLTTERGQGRLAGDILILLLTLKATNAAGIGEGVTGESSEIIDIPSKIINQMDGRGWTLDSIDETLTSDITRAATNKATGGSATAYFNSDGSYVVVDDATGQIIQISDRNDPNWVPDSSIKDPYIPQK